VVVVDERQQAVHGGELNVPVARGQYDPRRIRGSLGQILARLIPGRRRAEEITVFDSTGLATHDVALGHAVLQAALRRGLGRRIPWPVRQH
jgi:ornithine cyclodeaminase/alanine dehydrogenase-like protein (mu-crystallin family)